MIILPGRAEVIENIKTCAENGEFNRKVEVGDPVFDSEKRQKVLARYFHKHKSPWFKVCNFVARRMLDVITRVWNRDTQIVGMKNLKGIKTGAIITSNHFNPSENTVIRYMAMKRHRRNIAIVSQDTNLGMTGLFGFFTNNIDIIPICANKSYMENHFGRLIQETLAQKRFILIYPEQEMWFNYRKPRPGKRGAYYYAAKNNVPVISCFVEIQELPEMQTEEFHKIEYTLHVLKTIYPDPTKSVRENSVAMMEIDYQQKKAAYEEAYGKPLTYEFTPWDIAGWVPEEEREK